MIRCNEWRKCSKGLNCRHYSTHDKIETCEIGCNTKGGIAGATCQAIKIPKPAKKCTLCRYYDVDADVYGMECLSCKRYCTDLFEPREVE